MTRVVGLKVAPNLEPFVRNGLARAGFSVVETIQPEGGLDCVVISAEQVDVDPFGWLDRTVSLLPVVVVLVRRDAELKRRLLRAGAAEVVIFDEDAEGVVEAIDDALSRAAHLSGRFEQLPAERVLQAVLEAAPVGIVVVDAAGRLIRSSRVVESIWGSVPDLGAADIVAKRLAFWADESVHRGEPLERDEWPMSRALCGETVENEVLDIEPVGQPGVRRRIVSAAAPVYGASGQVIGAVVAEVDLSPVVLAEAGLRESETRFRELADNIAQMAWMTDATGFIHWYNRRWYDYTSLSEMQGWGWQAVHHPEHVDRVTEKFKYHLVFGEPWEDIFPLRRHDGEYRWF